MKIRLALAGGLAALTLGAALPASAQESTIPFQSRQSVFTRALGDVERAFLRRQSTVDATGERPAAPSSMSDLQAHGFFTSHPAVSLTVTRLDAERSQVCMQMRVTTKELLAAAAQMLGTPGVVRADASCNPMNAAAKLSWPGVAHVIKVLETQDSMGPTMVPTSLPMTGVDTSSRTTPGLTLEAAPDEWSTMALITIVNPALLAADGKPSPSLLEITKATVRSGFQVEHNCVAVPAQYSCSVGVRYLGSAERFRIGSLKLHFNNDKVAVVSLLGTQKKSVDVAPIRENPGNLPSAVSPAEAVVTAGVLKPENTPSADIPAEVVVTPGVLKPGNIPALVTPSNSVVVAPVIVRPPTPVVTLPSCNEKNKKWGKGCIPQGQAKKY